uniref:Uncharacterized protein n=2 Tax=Avena sativa TaxID=4498 RepID=A0ACD5Y5K0_AVESA
MAPVGKNGRGGRGRGAAATTARSAPAATGHGTPTESTQTPDSNASQAAENSAVSSPRAHPESSQGIDTGDADVEVAVDQAGKGSNKRKLKSDVWDDFTKEFLKGKWRAVCNWCRHDFAGESNSGTTHLRNHRNTCPSRHAPIGPKQQKLKLSKDVDGSVSLENTNFNQEVARKELALMICVHEYPLSIVDHARFRKFCNCLQPLFKVVSRNTIRQDIINMYEVQRDSMVKYFANFPNRVAITTDLWTANHQKKGYMAVTAHYIDGSWNLKSFLLRFMYVPCPHNAEVICEALHACLVEWHLEKKISTVTLDNCTSNDKAMQVLPDKLDTNALMLEGKYVHMRCVAHILNLVVKDGLAVMEPGVERVRGSVGFWSATPKRHEKFEKMARLMNIEYTCRLSLDCKTRWNSTYIMLSGALQYKDVFARLSIREKKFTCPTSEDWEFAKEVCERLKVFFDITELLSGSKYVTANIFFPKICGIRLAIRKWRSSEKKLIKAMSEEMKDKFEKYWSDVHGLMAIATILDPRFKLHMLQDLFQTLYGYEHATKEVGKIRQLMLSLLVEYQQPSDGDGTSNIENTPNTDGGVDEIYEIFDEYMNSKPAASSSQVRTELDLYLEEDLLPRTQELDIIGWWKYGGIKYPTLQMIAHDILPIPVTSVASECVFSASGRLISPHRSRLAPKISEALMCMQSWSRADMLGDVHGNLLAVQNVLEDEQEEMDANESIVTEE